MTFQETQKAKLLEYKNMAQQTEQEILKLREEFQKHEQAKVEIQKIHTEAAQKLNSYLQSIHVLEGVLKDFEGADAEPAKDAPVEAAPVEVDGPTEEPKEVRPVSYQDKL